MRDRKRSKADHPSYTIWKEMMEENPSISHQKCIKKCYRRAITMNEQWHRILDACPELVGVELKHGKDDRYAVILPDTREEGMFRALYFDDNGVSGHQCENSAEKVLESLVRDGFTELAIGKMDELSRTAKWRAGCRWTELIGQHNAGEISFEQVYDRYDEFCATFQVA